MLRWISRLFYTIRRDNLVYLICLLNENSRAQLPRVLKKMVTTNIQTDELLLSDRIKIPFLFDKQYPKHLGNY